MDSKSDSIQLSYQDNDELKAALGGMEPGDEVKLTLIVTVRGNDDDGFDALIDEVEVAESEEPEDEDEETESDEDEDEDSALSVMKSKKDDE